jgi:hypothetical protein
MHAQVLNHIFNNEKRSLLKSNGSSSHLSIQRTSFRMTDHEGQNFHHSCHFPHRQMNLMSFLPTNRKQQRKWKSFN